MFKYRFPCDDKDDFISQINEKMSYDRPNEMGRYAYPLFVNGFHFTQNGEYIKGFYTTNGRTYRGGNPPFRTNFNGRFIEENGKSVFEVQFYPQIIVFLIILAVIILSSVLWHNYFLSIVAFVLFCIFGCLYFKATKEAVAGFKRMTVKSKGE